MVLRSHWTLRVYRVKSMGGLRQLQRAGNGGPGGNQKKIGNHGADKVIQV